MRSVATLSAVAALALATTVFALPAQHASPAFAKTLSASSALNARQRNPDDDSQIRAVLNDQVAAWNRGDVDAFMNGYWRSSQTLFIGANGVTRGWLAVLDRYHRNYPGRAAMGHLTFSNIEIQEDCPKAAIVIGEYHLHREHDHPSGVFTLNFRKFPEGWRITVDHTTAFANSAVPTALH